MKYLNRVTIQGYLEIQEISEIILNNTRMPYVRAYVLTGTLERHRTIIAGTPAEVMLSILHRMQDGILLDTDKNMHLSNLKGRPFVSLEGELQDGVVVASWLSVLAVPDNPTLRLLSDDNVRDVVQAWNKLSHVDRELIARIARETLQKRPDGGEQRVPVYWPDEGTIQNKKPGEGQEKTKARSSHTNIRPVVAEEA